MKKIEHFTINNRIINVHILFSKKDAVLKFHKDNTEDDVELQTRKWLKLAPLRVKNREMPKIKFKYCPVCKML